MAIQLVAETTVYNPYAISRRFTTNELAISILNNSMSAVIKESQLEELLNGDQTMYDKITTLTVDTERIEAELNHQVSYFGSEIDAIGSQIAGIYLDLESFRAEISSTYATQSSVSDLETTMSSRYATLELSLDNFKTTVSNTYATQSSLNGLAETVDSKYADLELSLEGFKTTVSSTYATQSSLNGLATTVDSRYAELSLSLDAFKTTVSSTYATSSSVSDLEKSVSSKYAELELSLNGFMTTVSSTYTTKTELATEVATLSSSITQLAGSIELKASVGELSSLLSVETGQITISSNRFVLNSTYTQITANGSLTCTNATINGGTFKHYNSNGYISAAIANNMLEVYSWSDSGEFSGGMAAVTFTSGSASGKHGISVFHDASRYLDISYKASGSTTHTAYMRFTQDTTLSAHPITFRARPDLNSYALHLTGGTANALYYSAGGYSILSGEDAVGLVVGASYSNNSISGGTYRVFADSSGVTTYGTLTVAGGMALDSSITTRGHRIYFTASDTSSTSTAGRALTWSQDSDGTNVIWMSASSRIRFLSSASISSGVITATEKFRIATGSTQSYANIAMNGKNITGAGNVASDARLKENIVPCQESALESIMKFAIRSFDYKEGTPIRAEGHRTFGIVAQEAEEVLPDAIRDEELYDEYENVIDTFKQPVEWEFIPLILKGIQELHQENESLKDRIQIIEEKLGIENAGDTITALQEVLTQSVPTKILRMAQEDVNFPGEILATTAEDVTETAGAYMSVQDCEPINQEEKEKIVLG